MDIASIRQIPLFRDLPEDALLRIGERVRLTRWPSGSIVFRKGDTAFAAYLVRAGAVEILTGGETDTDEVLVTLGPGNIVGELALLTGERRSATLRAGPDTELLALDRADFELLLRDHPTIGSELSRQIGRRLVDTTRLLTAAVPTRVTAAWGRDVRALAAALVREGGAVGVLALPGALPELGVLPGAVAIPADGLDPAALRRWEGERVQGLDHILIVLPDRPDGLAHAARRAARHVVVFGPPPLWMRGPAGGPLQIRCDPGPDGTARALRWITGRAVGLALSSGGSKAVAHVGVLEVLRERGVVIDAVAGSSGGALAAVAVGFDVSPADVISRVHDLARHTRLHRFDFHVVPRAGLFKGVRLRRLFESWLPGADLSDARVPVWLLATNVHTGEEVVLHRGPVSDALRASMSIPAAFDPWVVDGIPLIDGAVVNPLPASVLRDAGLGVVVASNVAGQELTRSPRGRSPHLVQTMARMITSMERELIKTQAPLVDVMIRPHVVAANSFDFSAVDSFVAEGARAARAALDGLGPLEWARIRPQVAAASGSLGGAPPTR